MKRVRNIALACALMQVAAFAEVSLSAGQTVNSYVSNGSWKYYKVNGGANAIKLFNLQSDLDLYVKAGRRPTRGNYDCRPYAGGTTAETCQVSPNQVIYIGVYGFTGSSFSLKAEGSNSPSPSPDPTNVLMSDTGYLSQGQKRYYEQNGGATSVKLSNLSGDLDLYVKSGRRPTLSNYDCRPYNGGTSSEECHVNPNEHIYIMVNGFSSSNYKLTVYGSRGPTPVPPTPTTPVANKAFHNAQTNLHKTWGTVTWDGVTQTGIWADYQYTYCARFVRMCFNKPRKHGDAYHMYLHYKNLNLIHTSGTPPKGAVVFYGKHYRENRNHGHTGIADGNGYTYSVTSHWRGVTYKPIHGTFAASYLGYVTANQYFQNY